MIPVNIALLKAKLSFYLGKVKQGQEVLVMDRSTPVARLIPSAESAQGLVVTPARRSPSALKKMRPTPARRRTDSGKLLRDERERR